MILKKISSLAISIFLLASVCATAQKATPFPLGTPEAEGVSSKGIYSFLEAAGKSKHEFHSIMILRHGKLIADGWWNPYRPDLLHSMYSVSKSFTSTAIGFAVTEKRITVNDKVISFFSDDLPQDFSPYLGDLTIKDLLTMSVGQEPDPTFSIATRDSNWVKAFLALPIKYKPGTKFLYNSLATYMLSAIVQKVTGQKEIDYLQPRLFGPLGIKGIDWETDVHGINTGGWGLRLKTADMAKLGQLYLQKGNWLGKQLLPKEWVEEATTMKIEQQPDSPQAVKDSSDWLQGYCYKFWRCRHHCYRADGAFGQYIIVMPDQDAVIAITSETADMQSELNLVWQYLLPAFHEGRLPADMKTQTALEQKLHALSLAIPTGIKSNHAFETSIADKSFAIEPNGKKIETLAFHFKDNRCVLDLKTDTALYTFSFGDGKWAYGQTKRHGPNLLGPAKGLPPFKVAGSYRWEDEHTLELTLRYIESPHTETITCHFDEGQIAVDVKNSFDHGSAKNTLKGAAVK